MSRGRHTCGQQTTRAVSTACGAKRVAQRVAPAAPYLMDLVDERLAHAATSQVANAIERDAVDQRCHCRRCLRLALSACRLRLGAQPSPAKTAGGLADAGAEFGALLGRHVCVLCVRALGLFATRGHAGRPTSRPLRHGLPTGAQAKLQRLPTASNGRGNGTWLDYPGIWVHILGYPWIKWLSWDKLCEHPCGRGVHACEHLPSQGVNAVRVNGA